MARILIVDDDVNICRLVSRVLASDNHSVDSVGTFEDLLDRMKSANLDIVFLDVHLPDKQGDKAITEVKALDPLMQVIIITGDLSVERAVNAIKCGASDYITKPFSKESIAHVVKSAMEKRKNMVQEVTRQRDPLNSINPANRLMGTSRKMCNVNLILGKVAQTPSTPVLIVGESGTGKELAAQAIHHQSSRKDNSLIKINCSAIPRPLIESELFGHEAGAFTDARSMRKGLFELADGGTIFLDEVGELDFSVQPKLLRVLEDRTVTRVGSGVSRPVDIRVIAATNRDLQAMCQEGTFRKDLYFRLAVMTVQMPPLRKHPEDIEVIAQAILRQKALELGRKVSGFSETVMRFFQNYTWPGNVRELKNMIERLIILSEGEVIHFEERHLMSFSFLESDQDFTESSLVQRVMTNYEEHNSVMEDSKHSVAVASRKDKFNSAPQSPSEVVPLEEIEKQAITDALTACAGNKSTCARRLGISRSTLQRKIYQYGLESDSE
ncbi:MAG: sigma-54-dependent transcriptional regulator [Sumerlaeia bacterium]